MAEKHHEGGPKGFLSEVQEARLLREFARVKAENLRLRDEKESSEEENRRLRERAEAQAALARVDDLTDLPNRRSLRETMDREAGIMARDSQPRFVMVVDNKNLKRINDDFGLDAGDLLLQRTAERLLEVTRAGDFVARTGGDEFTIVGCGDSVSATRLAERLQSEMGEIPLHMAKAVCFPSPKLLHADAAAANRLAMAKTYQEAQQELSRSKSDGHFIAG